MLSKSKGRRRSRQLVLPPLGTALCEEQEQRSQASLSNNVTRASGFEVAQPALGGTFTVLQYFSPE